MKASTERNQPPSGVPDVPRRQSSARFAAYEAFLALQKPV
jgi:hypothetical protein